MASFNQSIILGNLTRDPELRYTPSGTPVATLGLASNRRYKDQNEQEQEETLFIDVVVWSKAAENCAQYLKKGRLVLVSGRLVYRTWETEGQKRSKHEIIAERVQFLPSGNGNSANAAKADTPAEPGADEVPF
jgi:single-strand DNA-binding protein